MALIERQPFVTKHFVSFFCRHTCNNPLLRSLEGHFDCLIKRYHTLLFFLSFLLMRPFPRDLIRLTSKWIKFLFLVLWSWSFHQKTMMFVPTINWKQIVIGLFSWRLDREILISACYIDIMMIDNNNNNNNHNNYHLDRERLILAPSFSLSPVAPVLSTLSLKD